MTELLNSIITCKVKKAFFFSPRQTTDADFEELMNRNRAVASTAITKAVSGATAGKCSKPDSGIKNMKP